MTRQKLLRARDLCLQTPAGRPLFRDLCLLLERGERVALVGRNGAGKSSLLRVLCGQAPPARGELTCDGVRVLVPQVLPARVLPGAAATEGPVSAGERRRAALAEALAAGPDFLLLDEPTHDLDTANIEWLMGQLSRFDGGLVVVSHDRRLLRTFEDFFVVTETGCHHVRGGFDALLAHLERERQRAETGYVRRLSRLADEERRNDRLRRRRHRKANLGRLHELRRAPSRAKLNENRSYAQVSQGKRAVLQRERIDAKRAWAKAARRALAVDLPLAPTIPTLPAPTGDPVVALDSVGVEAQGRPLFSGRSLTVGRERIAVVGPNGSGKSTLLEILAGQRAPSAGRVRSDPGRLGYVAQDAANWCLAESLLEVLARTTPLPDIDAVARTLRAHRFPFALAERPLASLSPGERLRAALLCLVGRRPTPELLLLDEPTDHLDFPGVAAVQDLLSAWPGGLVVVSHDRELLDAIGIGRRIELGGTASTS